MKLVLKTSEVFPSVCSALLFALLFLTAGCGYQLEDQSDEVEIPSWCKHDAYPGELLSMSGVGEMITPSGAFRYHHVDAGGWNIVPIDLNLSGSSAPRRQVVFFDGGPRNSPLSKQRLRSLERTYDDQNTNIVVIAHSGTDLPNLDGTKRLKTHGLSATFCDALLADIFLRENGYLEAPDVVVHGHSLGSLLALQLATKLEGDVKFKLVLQGPWLVPETVDEIINSDKPKFYQSPTGIVVIDRQEHRDELESLYRDIFKLSLNLDGTGAGDEVLSQLREDSCRKVFSPVIFLIGEFEDMADIHGTEDFASCFGGLSSVEISAKAPHGSELAVQSTRDALSFFLQAGD